MGGRLPRISFRRRWRFIAVFAFIFTMIVAEIALAYQTTLRNMTSDQAVNLTQEVIALADQAMVSLTDMQNAYRGFLLTGDEAFLQPLETDRASYRDALQQLEQQASVNRIQIARWKAIEFLAADWEEQQLNPAIERRRGLPADQRAQVPLTSSEIDSRWIDQMRGILGQARSTQQSVLAQRMAVQRDEDANLLSVLLWGTTGAALLALILGAWTLMHLERERLAGVWLAIQTSEHELYNCLSTAQGYLGLLLREPELMPLQRRWAERSHRAIVAAAGTVAQMRTLPYLKQREWSKESGVTIIDLERRSV